MKKIVVLLMMVMISTVICSCGAVKEPEPETTTQPAKPETVVYVEGLIDDIGEVTIKSKDLIDKAEKEYGYLKDSEKEQVENYVALKRARDEFTDVFDKFLIGTWECTFTAEGDSRQYGWASADAFCKKGDELTFSFILLDGGIAERIEKNITTGKEFHLGGKDDPGWKLSWSLRDDAVNINQSYAGEGVLESYGLKIDFENGTLVDVQSDYIYKKAE